MFGGGGSYQVKAVFDNAGQLVPGNQVRVGGQPIGKISDIELDDQANAVVTMQVDDTRRAAPRGHDGDDPRHVAVRHREPLRLAEARAELEREDRRRRADRRGRDLRAGGPRRAVQLARREDARAGSRTSSAAPATSTTRAGVEAGQSIQYFAPFLGSTSRLTREVALDQQVLTRFLNDGADTVSAIAERRDDLANLVSNTNADDARDRRRERVAPACARAAARARCARRTRRS